MMAIVLTIPAIEWLRLRNWSLAGLSALALFPLLGLWAWSIMWTHYALGAIRISNSSIKKNYGYSKVSMYIVLGLILLHPGLLAYGMWNLTGLLPPSSYYSYVAPGLKLYVIFGVVALALFLSYDVFERLKDKTWVKRHWFWISLSQAFAMVLIFVHSLKLGQNLHSGWFQMYWILLGALLIPCFALVLRTDWSSRSGAHTTPSPKNDSRT